MACCVDQRAAKLQDSLPESQMLDFHVWTCKRC
jgi:hypothetical protein